MEKIQTSALFVGLGAIAVSAAMTLGVRTAAQRLGFVAKPKSDRWHKRPTAMMGGFAIFFTTLLMYSLFVPKTPESLIVIGTSSFLFIVGLFDDVLNIKPYQKLFGQLIGATAFVGLGPRLPLTGYELVDIWITVLWLIGITNAINLLDNMDGLAAGIAAIAAASLAIGFAMNGQTNELLLVSVFIGALLGFLIFNFNPASIFLGDTGSMFIGFCCGTLMVLFAAQGQFKWFLASMVMFSLPLLDTTLAFVRRYVNKRPIFSVDKYHLHHQLVARGFTVKQTVVISYGLSFAFVLLGAAIVFTRTR